MMDFLGLSNTHGKISPSRETVLVHERFQNPPPLQSQPGLPTVHTRHFI